MAVKVTPGVFDTLFGRVDAAAKAKTQKALSAVALIAERQAKINVSNGSHRYGTPTVARRGEGPSIISGTLRRSITHTPAVAVATGFAAMVGAAPGFYPPYPRRGRNGGPAKKTMSSAYGGYLEKGLRNGATYPWLTPACKWAMGSPAATVFAQAFASGWPTL